MCVMIEFSIFFFFKETATTDIYAYGHTLSLHEALPISQKTAGYEGLLSMGRRFKSCRARQLSDFCRVYAMESRDPLLQDFLTNLAEAFRAQAMRPERSEGHTSELQSLMRISYAVFCLTKQILRHDNLLTHH